MALLEKLLVANRGEIALHIIKTAKKLGIKTVAIHTAAEKASGYVMLADERVSFEEDELSSTFLNINSIIGIAIATGSNAIHPGYGFLSENAAFARACEKNQIFFIGPGAETLELMGNKPKSKQFAANLGIPVVFSHKIEISGWPSNEVTEFPALIKPSYGGGGKGMKIVYNQEELTNFAEESSRSAMNYFGNGAIFVEKQILHARHVEVQLLGDKHGGLIHLFDRECSIQRNHQKILEEAPALFLSPELRVKLLTAALKIGKAANYVGAGTVEFLVDTSGNYYFMEMNPRIQVEYAVTEQITGVDIVAEQLRIAAGLPLSIAQEEVTITGHAIEVRVYTEDPAKEFAPSTAPLRFINLPKYQNLRLEADFNLQQPTGNQFDPLLLKLITWGANREEARRRVLACIGELNVIGPKTNTKYLERILTHEQYQQNNLSVEFCKNNHQALIRSIEKKDQQSLISYLMALAIAKNYLHKEDQSVIDPWKYLGYWRLCSRSIPLMINEQLYQIQLNVNDNANPYLAWEGTKTPFKASSGTPNHIRITIDQHSKDFYYLSDRQGELHLSHQNMPYHLVFPGLLPEPPATIIQTATVPERQNSEITSPMHGKILKIYVKENQLIKKNDPLLVIEAMKSENKILSHKDARIRKIAVNVGTQVTDRMPLILLED